MCAKSLPNPSHFASKSDELLCLMYCMPESSQYCHCNFSEALEWACTGQSGAPLSHPMRHEKLTHMLFYRRITGTVFPA